MPYGISFPGTRISGYALRVMSGPGLAVELTGDVLMENSPPGTLIGTLSCIGTIGTPVFTLIDDAGGRVALSSPNNSSVIAGLVSTDFDVTTFFNFAVSITGVSPQLPNMMFTVYVGNANEAVPVIVSNGGGATAAISIPENSTAVTTVVATDADIDSVVTYSIVGGSDESKFTINPNTGVLAFTAPPDYEFPTDTNTDNEYVVIVQASDGTFADTQIITVAVTDLGDDPDVLPPTITSPSVINQLENLTFSQTLTANEAATWEIVGGADAGLFELIGAQLTLAPKNFEAPGDADGNNQYVVQVQATDTSFNTSTVQTITVTVTAVNEFAPVINSNGGGPTAAISIPEGTTAVTTVAATDADAGDAITYAKSGGADAARFNINPSTGVLTFAVPPSYGAPTDADFNNQYIVIVQASDGSNTDTQTITVTVTQVVTDTIPDPFTFVDVTGAALSTLYESNSINVTGIDAPSPLTITGGQYQLNGAGAWSSSPTTVVNGNTVKVRTTSSASNATDADVVLTIGTVSDTYRVRTAGAVNVRLVVVAGDSNSVGRGLNNEPVVGSAGETNTYRDPVLDQDMTDVWQYRNNAAFVGYQTLSADITPLHHPDGSGAGTVPYVDRVGPGEQVGRSLKTRYPSDIIVIIPCAKGGTALVTGTPGCAPGGAQYVAMVAAITDARAKAVTQWPTYPIIHEMVFFDAGGNDQAGGIVTGGQFHAAQAAMIAAFRTTGQPTWSGVRWCFAGLPYELVMNPSTGLPLGGSGPALERAFLQTVSRVSNVYYVKSIADAPNYDADNLHRIAATNRDLGNKAAVVDQDTTVPVWPALTTIYNAAYYVLDVSFAGDFAITGVETSGVTAVDANFEIGGVYGYTRTLRFISNGVKSSGSHSPALTLIGGNRVTSTPSVTVNTVTAGSIDLGTIIGPTLYGFSFDPAAQTLGRQSQNSDGTGTVAVDTGVGRVVDSSNNAITLIQATPANKPTLKSVVGTTTVWGWEGDGVNDILAGPTPVGKNFGVGLKFTVVVLIKAPSNGAGKPAVAENPASGPAFLQTIRTNAGTDITPSLRNDATSTVAGAGAPGVLTNAWKVVTVQYAPNSISRVRVDGVQVTEISTGSLAGPVTLGRLGLFGPPLTTPTGYFAGTLGGVWGIAEFVSVGMLAIAERDFAMRAGITLPGGPPAIGAPTLDLVASSDTGSSTTDNITFDTTPDLDITFAQVPVENDTITVRDNGVLLTSHTITALEAGSSTIDLVLPPLTPDGSHKITVSHSSPSQTGTFSAELDIIIDTGAPVITTSASLSKPEGEAFSESLAADGIVVWTKVGGADAVLFTLSGNNLTLPIQDYSSPNDANGDNFYEVTVRATDVAGNFANKTILVEITEVVVVTATTRESFMTAMPLFGGGVAFYAAVDTGDRQSSTGGVFVTEA